MLQLNDHNRLDAMYPTGSSPETDLLAGQTGAEVLDGVRERSVLGGAAFIQGTTGAYTHAAVRMHDPVRKPNFETNAVWSNCPKFGKTPHFQRWKVAD